MPVSVRAAIAAAALAGTAAGIAYTAAALARTRRFRHSLRAPDPASMPPITVLKPLYGEEPELYENLRSFCEQRYPQFQIVLGAADPADPALETARRIGREFPECDIEIVAGRAQPSRNPKVGNLLGMIDRAKYGVVAIADSDIRVGPEYLQALASCFADDGVGAATCLYGAAPGETFASKLAAMHVNDEFSPSVLVALALEPLTYCFGATMAVRAGVLERIGGLQALADHLGDDFRLGKLVAQAGYRVELCRYVVRTAVADRDLFSLWRHELRWARTIRAQRPAGYAGSAVTYALPIALAYAALCRRPSAGALAVGLAAALRLALHREAEKTFAPGTGVRPWLVPVRDFLSLGVWCAGLSGRRVAWREHEYGINPDGRMLGNADRM